MIDRSLINLDKLLDQLIGPRLGYCNQWMAHVEIIPNYMPPFPTKDTQPACVVRFKKSFLRYSCGPAQGFFWDIYGDNFLSPELALIAVSSAQAPPSALKPEMWE